MTKLSIAIPVYEAKGRGIELIQFSLSRIRSQTFKDFNVIISDNSSDNVIENAIKGIPQQFFDIKYFRNDGPKTMASNINNAIRNSDGEIIQILCQDDYLYDKNSLQTIVNKFNPTKKWMVSTYMHTKDRFGMFKKQIPSWNDQIYFNNTIGTPTCLSLLNEYLIYLDENLSWFVDCEYYYQLFKKWGLPEINNNLVLMQLLWEGQITNTQITEELIKTEREYIVNKYEGKIN